MITSLLINDSGFADQAKIILSPNFDNRPNKSNINLIVIHNISLPPSQFGGGYIQQFFQNKLDWSLHPYFQTISAHWTMNNLQTSWEEDCVANTKFPI